jgi:hypothetical protein
MIAPPGDSVMVVVAGDSARVGTTWYRFRNNEVLLRRR